MNEQTIDRTTTPAAIAVVRTAGPAAHGAGRPALRRRRRLPRGDAGMSTAEYAVGTIAACGFAAVLYKIVTSGPVRSALTGVIEKALHVPF